MRKFIVLFLVHSSSAQALPSLKIMLCELMLNSSLKEFSTGENVRPALHQLIARLGVSNSSDVRPVSYAGPLTQLSGVKAGRILARLNGLEQALARPSLDAQVYALEIRGDKISQAWAAMNAQAQELRATYRREANVVYPENSRALINLISLYGLWGGLLNGQAFLQSLADGLSPTQTGVFLGSSAVTAELLRMGVKFYLDRSDWSLDRLQAAMTNPGDDFVLLSSNIEVPSEFNRALMSGRQLGDGRREALRQWGGSFPQTVIERVREPWREPPETLRAYMDLALYRDEEGQNVWLLIYRAVRKPESATPTQGERELRLAPVRVR